MAYFNSKVKKVSLWQANGARPVVSPDGKYVAYDYKGSDQMYDIRLALIDQPDRYIELTAGRAGLPQRNNGNVGFHPQWPTVPIIVFSSEAPAPHYLDHIPIMGDTGIGLFCNLWALNVSTGIVYQLTNYPIKMTAVDGITVQGVVFPRFSWDGTKLLWTRRYADGGGYATPSWGKFRLSWADFTYTRRGGILATWGGVPSIGVETTVYDPFVSTGGVGNYVVCTAGFFPNSDALVVASNRDGQHEFNMDLYTLDISVALGSGGVSGFANTMPAWGANSWEEGSAICPITVAGGGVGGGVGHKILYMSNITSPYGLDYTIDWVEQETWRELWYMNTDGSGKTQLTKFNKYVPISIEDVVGSGGLGLGATIDDSGVNGGEGVYDEFIRPYGRAHPAAMNFTPDGMSIFVLVAGENTAPYPVNTDALIAIYRIDLNELL